MFNFLDAKLTPKVTCKAPSTDNYEPENLIHPNQAVRSRGYLAYTVTKPPVDLDFEFLCSINIDHININTCVGKQKSTGIEIFAKCDNSDYLSIGKTVTDNGRLVFCNSRRYNKDKLPLNAAATNSAVLYFNKHAFRAFLSASSLKIRIFRTEGRCVPCLGSIQVYGSPARTCSQITVDTINKIMGPSPVQKSETKTAQNKFIIPEDFTDDLTCEIMAIPMTLPSGKTIDRDTLERHIQNEASFGRKPGDPFTGLKFSDHRKPVLNVALKSRIDMFLLQNSDNAALSGVKRTLGGHSYESATKRLKLRCDYGGGDGDSACCSCKGHQILYVIPCKHFYCRSCLLNLTDYKCNCCGESFVRGEAVRFHV